MTTKVYTIGQLKAAIAKANLPDDAPVLTRPYGDADFAADHHQTRTIALAHGANDDRFKSNRVLVLNISGNPVDN